MGSDKRRTIMAYTVITSTHGISLQDGSKVITLSDTYEMFDAIDADPSLVNSMRTAIMEQYTLATEDLLNSFGEVLIMNPEKVMAYINAMRQWLDVVTVSYPQYRAAIAAAQAQDVP